MNNRILNWSIVISLLAAYILPGTSPNGFEFEYGYPFKFFTIYNTNINIGDTIFDYTLFNPLTLCLNIVIVYYIIYIFNKFIEEV